MKGSESKRLLFIMRWPLNLQPGKNASFDGARCENATLYTITANSCSVSFKLREDKRIFKETGNSTNKDVRCLGKRTKRKDFCVRASHAAARRFR